MWPLLLAGVAVMGASYLWRQYAVKERAEAGPLLSVFRITDATLATTRSVLAGQLLNMWLALELGNVPRTVSVELVGPGLDVYVPPTPLQASGFWEGGLYIMRVPFTMAPLPPGQYEYRVQVGIDDRLFTERWPLEVRYGIV